jgi:transposase
MADLVLHTPEHSFVPMQYALETHNKFGVLLIRPEETTVIGVRLHEEFGISVSDDTVYRALKELGFSDVSARPKAYKQDPEAIEAFKKTFPPAWRRSALRRRRG